MNGYRRRGRSHLRSTEVTAMTPTGHTPRRLDVPGRPRAAIHALDVCGVRLHDARQARVAPKGLTPAKLSVALELRRQVRGESA